MKRRSASPLSSMATIARVLAAKAALVMFAGAAHADNLSGPQIVDIVNGKRIYLATPFGGEFPLHYRRDGRVTGDGTAHGLARHFAPRETGRWFVQGDQLCQQFPTWYKGRLTCFTLRRTGETSLRWRRDDGFRGRARIGR